MPRISGDCVDDRVCERRACSDETGDEQNEGHNQCRIVREKREQWAHFWALLCKIETDFEWNGNALSCGVTNGSQGEQWHVVFGANASDGTGLHVHSLRTGFAAQRSFRWNRFDCLRLARQKNMPEIAAFRERRRGKVARHDDLPENQVRFERACVAGAKQPARLEFIEHRASARFGGCEADADVRDQHFLEPEISQKPFAGADTGGVPQHASQTTALVRHGESDNDHDAVHGSQRAASTNVVVSPDAVRYGATPSAIMNFDRHLLFRSTPFVASLALAIFFVPVLRGQAPPQPQALDQQRFQQGQQLYNEGKYADALKAFESVQKDFPTSAFIPAANLQAGLCYYYTGQFDQGVLALRKNVATKTIAPEILEDSQALIPQLLVAKAQKLPPEDPGRKPALEIAIKEFDTFIQKFPQSPEVEQANLGKARSFYGLEKYDDAAKSLRENMQKFPSSESALDTQFMLSVILTTEANALMKTATVGAENKQADAVYDEAEKLLRDIIKERSRPDFAVMNDAQFQLGEMLVARANAMPKGDAQDKTLYKALDAYRNTFSKEVVLAAQKALIKYDQDRQTEAGKNRNVPEFRRLQSLVQRETGKIADLEARPDQTLAAKIKMGQIYLTLHKDKERERMDEARVLFHFVEKFTEDPEQKKQLLYLITVTYAAQHLTARAEEHYQKWIATYKNDPIGENLPLLLGAMYLDPDPKRNNPQKALEYFKKQETDFPQSSFAGEAAMQAALAMIQLKQFKEATEALKAYLARNPNKDQAAVAEFGLATVYKDSGKAAEAIETFRAVRNKYPATEQAEQAGYWVGQMLYDKGDPKGAVAELKEYVTKFPNSELLPAAMLALGKAQRDSGQRDAGLATFKELAEKFPKSEAAPYAYFQMAGMFDADGKYAELEGVMKEFANKYPQNPDTYKAYDYIAQIEGIREKKFQDAIATYEEFVEKFPTHPDAGTAILRISDLWRKDAESMGKFISIPLNQRDEWKKRFDKSVEAAERVLEKYPESSAVALALQNLLTAQKQFVLAKMKADTNVEDYFNALAKKFADKPTTVAKIKFTLAGYFSKKDPAKAAEMMQQAYDEKLIFAPADLELYADALIAQKKYDDVEKIAQKLAKDYPLPPNSDPAKLSSSITEPRALSMFYSAKVLQLTGKSAEAASKFAELKKLFSWSPKLAEADLGIATDLFEQKKYDEASKLLLPVASNPKAPAEIRAQAMMLLAKIAEAEGDIDSAINNYIKLATFFEGLPEYASEGLWRGAQLQEKKASGELKQIPKVPVKELAEKKDFASEKKAPETK
jgi:TolA-binding protein